MRILEGGPLTTVQDLGRYGYQKLGVTPAGAMDTFSLRVANILVANPEGAAALEITLEGARIEFTSDALVAVCGADLAPQVSDITLPRGHAIAVRAGATLSFRRRLSGCRAYLAVAGGVDVPLVLGSRSTHLRAGFGGYEGRALRRDDEMPIGRPAAAAVAAMVEALSHDDPVPFALSRRRVPVADGRGDSVPTRIRCIRGPHFDQLANADQAVFLRDRFQVGTQADRMGYRLRGPRLTCHAGGDLLSTAVTAGTIQLPPGGEPIVLMADRQTTGGYPMIAQVISADLPLLAQLAPDDEIAFVEADLAEAQARLRATEARITEIRTEVEAGASDRPQR